MPTLDPNRSLCTVIVTVDAPRETLDGMMAHAERGLTLFAEFPGFLGGALHRSTDGGRLVQYLQWATEADHLGCMQDPRWETIPSTRQFMEIVESGRATLDVRTYEVLATAEGPDPTSP